MAKLKTKFNREQILALKDGKINGSLVRGLARLNSERHVWKIHSDMSTDHSSLLYFLLGIVPPPALTLALSLSFTPYFLPFQSHLYKSTKHNVVASVRASPSRTLHSALHYLQFTSDATLVHKQRARHVLGLHWGSEEHKQPLALQAKNDLTHSISLASILTASQHGEAAASKSDTKDCYITSDNTTEDG